EPEEVVPRQAAEVVGLLRSRRQAIQARRARDGCLDRDAQLLPGTKRVGGAGPGVPQLDRAAGDRGWVPRLPQWRRLADDGQRYEAGRERDVRRSERLRARGTGGGAARAA